MTTGTVMELMSVYFTDANNGVIVGGNPLSALILKTTNGGTSWFTVSSPATDFLRGVFFPSSSIGYAVGWNGEILKSVNGGGSWVTQTPAAVYGNLDVYFTDDNTGYLAGGLSGTPVQKTTDGGANWFTQNSAVTGLVGIYFPTATIGYAVGQGGGIIKTTNGGVGISEPRNVTKINLYPNPTTDFIGVYTDEQVDKIELFDANGKLVKSVYDQTKNINIGALPTGVYFVNITTGAEVSVQRVLKY
jgi:photosystem II stability/assembly factor-like uncharacterized protein